MENRRSFIRKSMMLCAAAQLPAAFWSTAHAAGVELKTRAPKRALVLCYSQTGMTDRYGRLMACTLKAKGLAVDLLDTRGFDKSRMAQYDLIMVGAPVNYYDIPPNVSQMLATIPRITGTPVAAFVSYGGPEGNQHNAVCHALQLLSAGGGAAVGMATFRSIPGYPTPGWDSENQRMAEHLPNAATYDAVRMFTVQVLERISRGETIKYDSEIAAREILRSMPLPWFVKKTLGRHTVDGAKCILCKTCVKKCPVGAIMPEKQEVNRDQCLACFGCLNNCPADAVVMEYRGKRLYGFPEYLKRRKITIPDPPEFQTCTV